MSKLKLIKAIDLERLLFQLGFEKVRQKGSQHFIATLTEEQQLFHFI